MGAQKPSSDVYEALSTLDEDVQTTCDLVITPLGMEYDSGGAAVVEEFAKGRKRQDQTMFRDYVRRITSSLDHVENNHRSLGVSMLGTQVRIAIDTVLPQAMQHPTYNVQVTKVLKEKIHRLVKLASNEVTLDVPSEKRGIAIKERRRHGHVMAAFVDTLPVFRDVKVEDWFGIEELRNEQVDDLLQDTRQQYVRCFAVGESENLSGFAVGNFIRGYLFLEEVAAQQGALHHEQFIRSLYRYPYNKKDRTSYCPHIVVEAKETQLELQKTLRDLGYLAESIIHERGSFTGEESYLFHYSGLPDIKSK